MKVITEAAEFAGRRPVCLAIGFFDGVHLGHQQVIRQTLADSLQHDGTPLVITFDRHPTTIVAPHRVPPLIYPLPRKLEAIEALGIQTTLLLHFDLALSRVSAPDFVRHLVRDLGPVGSICVGSNFVFGYQRAGNVALLKELGAELNFRVHGLSAVALDGQVISSTRIRDAIRAGNLDAAGQMLGRPYSITGKVVKGDEIGRTLGFPTANLDVTSLVLPPNGVYAIHALTPDNSFKGVLNIGLRPTLQAPTPQLRVEAHLLGVSVDLYGQELEVTPLARLRDEIKFASTKELQTQITRDIAQARKLFG